MGDYRPNTCDFCQADTWCEQRKTGKWQCRACEVERFFEFLYRPLGFELIDWQRKVLREMYGTIQQEDGRRQYRRALIELAKKNGKTFLVGGLPIYHLVVEADRITNPRAFGAAAAKDQASLVFQAAMQLVRANPDVRDLLRILESTKRIVRRDGHGVYAVLSADGELQDGVEPSLNLLDEVHRWRSVKAETLHGVLHKGTISQPEPLSVQITTAGGDESESPIWHGEHEYAMQVLDGTIPDKRFYAAIFSADPKRIEKEPDYWRSREARVAANPSHEDNRGGFLKDEAIVEELNKALANPHKKGEYLRLHLNLSAPSLTEQVIDMEQWQRCGGDVDLRLWPEYDVELLISKWGLAERPCYLGVDASWTTDTSGLLAMFPPAAAQGIWTMLVWAWLPKDRLKELERITRMPLESWAERKFLETTPGNAIDPEAILAKIRWCAQMFDVAEVAFDPWNFRGPGAQLNEEGITAINITQNYAMLSEPTKKVLELYADNRLQHGNHPVLNWHARCLALQGDKKDNIQPDKPQRTKSSKRIDLIQAAVNAMNRALLNESKEYTFTGLRSVV